MNVLSAKAHEMTGTGLWKETWKKKKTASNLRESENNAIKTNCIEEKIDNKRNDCNNSLCADREDIV